MKSIENWWHAEIEWETPAGQLLRKFMTLLPEGVHFRITLYGSAPLQMTLDHSLLSADIDLFSEDEQDIRAIIRCHKLDKEQSGFYLKPGYELSFRTSPRWRARAKTIEIEMSPSRFRIRSTF